MRQRFVLLDRDGVLNEAVRDGYVTRVEAVRLLPGAAQAVAKLNRAGFGVIVVSNQQCVGKDLISSDQLHRITTALQSKIQAESGGTITEFFYCPHLAADECSCRKPKPGMVYKAQERYGFRLDETFFVGDSYSDMETARRSGCRAVFVLSGLDAQRPERGQPLPQHVELAANDLLDAVDFILKPDQAKCVDSGDGAE